VKVVSPASTPAGPPPRWVISPAPPGSFRWRLLLALAPHLARRSLAIHLAERIAITTDAIETDEQRTDLIAALYEAEAGELVRLARLFTDDRNAAEDLVQEAFIRLYHAAHRIEEPERAISYLRSIVLNLARDHNRRGLMSLRHHEPSRSHAAAELPADRLELDEQHAQVLKALRALSPQQRNCLVLRYYLELSEGEIARTLDISPNSVKTHCRRGLERLRTRLEPEDPEGTAPRGGGAT
jgi:RNA polymerase sigma-70 factor (sigma-E family)